MDYKELTKEVLEKTLADELKLMKKYQKEGKVVDMTRGRPCREQLDLSVPMFDVVKGADFMSQGIDVRNYGGPPTVRVCRLCTTWYNLLNNLEF